jgi:hypothetical protein
MTDERKATRDTKEFVAGWQNIVEEHVVGDLAGALRKLAAPDTGGEPYAALARHVTHALQLAAAPTGGVQAAVRYLCEVAGHDSRSGTP